MSLTPPVCPQIRRESAIHGETRVDNYFWLRDRDNPAAIAYLEAENAYTREAMAGTAELQQTLYDEILGRIKEDDSSVPAFEDGWYYYTRTEKGKPYAIYCRKRESLDAPEQVMLDGNQLAVGHDYYRLGAFAVSPDHSLLAYSVDHEGDEVFTLRIKNLASGELLPDVIANSYYSLAWAADNRTFFYTILDDAKRAYRLYRHQLGTPEDTLIYEETDAKFDIGVGDTRSQQFIFLQIDSSLTSEVRYLKSTDPLGEFQILFPRQFDVEYDVEHQGDWFYIRTNEGAQNFRLMRTPVSSPSKDNWTEVIPGRPDITLEAVDGFKDYLVLQERVQGLESVRYSKAGDLTHWETIEFPETVYTAGITANPVYDSHVLRLTYSSPATPPSVFDIDLLTKVREVKKVYEVPGYDPSQYHAERIVAQAPDGTGIPISIVHRKDQRRPAGNPTLLYGYGSYGLNSDPDFDSSVVSLLNRGFVFAIAHIRGGGDMGKYWHDAGKLTHKRNTFTDFIACAEHLIATGTADPKALAIRGGSAGGLLVGAVLNMRPDLFRLAIAKVPFVDCVNTMLDPTLPLTIQEYEEWGNPEDPTVYHLIRSYSPYDNVEPKSYPTILVTAGLNDPRVAYWEPAKWVAKLRALKTDSNLLLLKTEMGAGHFGPSGRYPKIRETAFDYAFLLNNL